jgi:poly(3-hydroxybutyrate) depolymerase
MQPMPPEGRPLYHGETMVLDDSALRSNPFYQVPGMMRENSNLYNLHELQYATIQPLRMMVNAGKHLHRNPFNMLSYTGYGRRVAAACEVMERITHRYGKPAFGLTHTLIDGRQVDIQEEVVAEKPFCRLIHFKRDTNRQDPRLMIVAPMSGHHSTLLRGTVEALLPYADVYITDWRDARNVSMSHGAFTLDDYTSYVIEFTKLLGPGTNLMAVCQPSVPVMMTAAIMNAEKDKAAPASMILIGGPIDTRVNPTKVNLHAMERSLSWFESNVITRVPFNYPGFMRRVYPGFLQLTGFMTLNLERHINEHIKLFQHLVKGDGDSAQSHKKFYDEYLSVCDLPAEFYLECIDRVFQRHLLPLNQMPYKGEKIDLGSITKTALLTLEGELDDISGVGQTKAAHALCKNLPESKQKHYMQKGVGHYGIFNGRKFREHVVPIISDFMKEQR